MSNLPALAMAEKDLIETLGNSLYPGADHNSIRMVISYCKASELDPMQKPVHIVPIWDSKLGRMRDVVMPGIGLYRTQAARSGQYAGVSEPEFGPDVTENIGGTSITFPSWCKVAVKRALPNGQIVEFFATERWKENYAAKGGKEKSIAPNAMWTKRPYGQLAKCAEAQALRKAFPEFGSQPTAEEMEGKEVYDERPLKQMGEAEVIKHANERYPDEKLKANSAGWIQAFASGTSNADHLIKTIGSKYELSKEQEASIRELEKNAKKNVATDSDVIDHETGEVMEQQ